MALSRWNTFFLLFSVLGCLAQTEADVSVLMDSISKAESNGKKIALALKGLRISNLPDSVRAEFHLQAANGYEDISDPEHVIQHDLEVLKLRSTDRQQALAFNGLGNGYHELGRYDEARKYFTTSLEIAKKRNSQNDIARALNNLGNTWIKEEKLPQALDLYLQALKICEEGKMMRGLSIVINNIAGIYRKQGKPKEALLFYEKSLKLADSLHLTDDVSFYLNNIGEVYSEMGQLEKALSYKLKAVGIAEKNQDFKTLANAYPQLSRIYALLGNYKEAYRYDTSFVAFREKRFTEETARTVADMQTKYDVGQKELENRLLRDKDEKSQSVIRLQYISGAAMVVILLLVSLLAWLQYRNSQRKEKYSQELERSKLEIETQRNQLEEFNHFKDKIFSIIAHDLRSPINSLQGMVSLFNEKLMKAEEMEPHFKELGARLNSTSTSLNNLLQWSRSHMENMEPTATSINVEQLVTDVASLFSEQAKAKSIQLKADVPNGLTLKADEEMMKVILRNLISNAIKFSRRESSVIIRATSNDHSSVIEIQD
ncbi:MAG: tetratricopeptide repeat-containing sensor histidine kinase, partial [Cyclobacteriaceae bacterium]|nr:tetratricopeptide repeat-containing sensor histidine kinase [Cyclobacteriaceae bacterium]